MLHRLALSSKKLGALLLTFCVVSVSLATSSGAAYQERPAAPAETIINSNITTDTTWTLANSPYRITNNIDIEAGVALTIEPGVQVWIGEKFYVHVREGASITAKGTPAQHITIDRYIDPVTHLGPRWKKIWFHENTTSYFRYVDFAYGGSAASSDDCILHLDGAGTHVLNNCTIQASKQQGIVATGASLNLTIAGTLFQNNGRYPIIADSGAIVTITGSTINAGDNLGLWLRPRDVPATITIADSNLFSNAGYSAVANGMSTVYCINAQNNWWGATNGPYDSSSASDACGLGSHLGGGSWATNGVDYRNWLAAQVPLAGITTPPNAALTVTPDPTVPQPPGTVYTFDASGSTDVEDYTSSLEVCWDWDNNGDCDTAWTMTKTATHVFATGVGDQTVRLVVRDTDGLTSGATQDVVLNSPPTAAFAVDPDPGTPRLEGTVYTFDASTSSDAEDATNLLEVCWDWDNSGNCDTAWTTTKTASHSFVYADGAVQTVRLVVRDTGDLTDEATRDIYVLQNQPPTAAFTVDPDPDTYRVEDTVYIFDASACSDAEDAASLLQVCWDWDNSGNCDTVWTTTKAASHSFVYADGAVQTVRLVVRDTAGLTGEATRDIHVLQNLPPTAAFTFTQSAWFTFTLPPGIRVDFDAYASTDDHDTTAALQVAWDYQGDGDLDTEYSTLKTAAYTYTHLGRYWPALYVKDTTGRVGRLHKQLDVIPPTAAISLTGSGGTLDSADGTVQVALYTDTVQGDVISNGLVITHTPWLTIPHGSLTDTFTYQGFTLNARSLLTDSQPINEISGTYTITISYDYDYFADVLHLPFEDQLELYRWSDTEALWTPVTFTLETANDRLVATTSFFGDFALSVDVRITYLPMIFKGY